jgi:hypothetical protein
MARIVYRTLILCMPKGRRAYEGSILPLCNHHQSVCRNLSPVDRQEYIRGDTYELEEVRFIDFNMRFLDAFLFLWVKWT